MGREEMGDATYMSELVVKRASLMKYRSNDDLFTQEPFSENVQVDSDSESAGESESE